MKLTHLALLIGTLATAVACGGGSSSTPAAATPDSSSAPAAATTSGGKRDLTVAGFGGTTQEVFKQIYFTPFANQTGKPVLEESYDGGYGILQSKIQSGNPNWDIVQVEVEELIRGCDDGLFEKLDWDKLGGKDKYIDGAASDCGVGNMVWSTILTYDGDKLKEAPKSWADFWNVEKFPGKRALRKGPKYTLEFALLADGVKKEDLYTVLATPEGLDRAFKKLDELKPHLIWWEAGAQPLQFLASGEVVMASTYSGRIPGLNKTENRNFKMVWPESIYAIDSWVILKDAANKDTAMDLIAFASLPENQVKMPMNNIAYGVTNKAAIPNVPAEFSKDLPTTPANQKDAIFLNGDFWIDNSEELTERFNAWLSK